ncbi:hypothetical protein [Cognatishimia activa]|uniref:hypothetical protein n=1 Tax=Cognatishimia activa TaxID=1715691 RepID=UPI0022320050|nr:hypothetical protein [Cognatishimia activa]UZD91642.1 hypothetical protein M0D42_03220 [Cognatishimia activa]
MADFNTSFELNVEDVELIEMALRKTKALMARPDLDETLGEDAIQDRDQTLHQIQDLLGRMHNQKVFYRPKNEVYIGG